MTQEWSRIYLEIISVLETTSKANIGPQHIFLKISFFSVLQKLILGVTNFEIHLVEYVHMDHTDHLGFR